MILSRVRTIAVREFLATVRRRAFVVTLILMPLYVVVSASIGLLPTLLAKRSSERRVVAVVDPGQVLGLPAGEDVAMPAPSDDAPRFRARAYPTLAAAESAFRGHEVHSILRLDADYLRNGRTYEYRRSRGFLTNPRSGPGPANFLRERLLHARVDSSVIVRVLHPSEPAIFIQKPEGGYEPLDPLHTLLKIFVPLGFGMILSLGIFTAGSYLLQGLGEEKESRILESLLALVTPDELLAGKLLGLGSAALVLVLAWGSLGFVSLAIQAPQFHIPATTFLATGFYFLFGYFFFASFMMGIGALVNSYQEANQLAALISLSAMAPFFLLGVLLDDPGSALAVTLSIFPWTSPVTMMLRIAFGGVPAWQIALSMALLAGATLFMLRISARLFRIGLLLYGKAPKLPEILRWARSA